MTSKNIENNAVFNIVNNQTYESHTDKIDVKTEGRFYFRDGSYFLLYTEYSDFGDVSVMIKASGDVVTIKKSGAVNARMEYIKNSKREVLYDMPFGRMVMDLETRKVENSLSQEGGSLRLCYTMLVNGEKYFNNMKIMVKKPL